MANTNDPSLPNARAALVDARGLPASEWRKFFEKLSRQPTLTADQSAEIAALAERVTTLEEATESLGSILGLGSVSVVGSLGNQVVIQLEGDEENPAASYYYGTGAAGVKGFWPALANPMTTEGDLIVGDVAGAPIRLPIGAEGDVLTVVSGVPAYAAPSGGAGGIGVSIGTYAGTATVLPAGTEATSIADGGYLLTGEWYMWCYPSATIEIDVWADVFGSIPVVGDSICGGAEPIITAGTFATGSFTGPVAIDRTDTLLAHINSNNNAKWVKLLLIGDRT